MNFKKVMAFTVFLMAILSITFIANEDKLDLPKDYVVAKVNGSPIYSELLDIETNLTITLLRIKQNDTAFYEVMTKTQEGYDFLVKYKDIMLDKIIDSVVLEKIAEDKGLFVKNEEIEQFVVNYLDNILETTNLTKDDFEKYILTQGYDDLQSYEKHLIFQRKTAMVNHLLMDKLIGTVNVSEEEIDEAILTIDTVKLDKITSVNLSHILLQDQKDASQVLQRINEVGFEQAAAEYSTDDLTKYNGGDLGWIENGVFPQFSVVFDKKPGDIVGPVKTELGYHILYIKEFSGGELGQENLRKEVKSEIEFSKRFSLWEEWLTNEFPKEKEKYRIEKLF